MEWDIAVNKVYEHYKGGKYLVLLLADDSTNAREGNHVVVYISLANGKTYCRDASEFTQLIKWDNGDMKPRFAASA